MPFRGCFTEDIYFSNYIFTFSLIIKGIQYIHVLVFQHSFNIITQINYFSDGPAATEKKKSSSPENKIERRI